MISNCREETRQSAEPQDLHEDRLRPLQTSPDAANEQAQASRAIHQTQRSAARATPPQRWQRPRQDRGRRYRSAASALTQRALPFVLLITLCVFGQIQRQPTTAGGAQAQFLFTYEINQESDENRVPRSSLFDPSSFRIVTPSQLQSSYQKLAGQTPEPVSTQSAVPPAEQVSALPAATVSASAPETAPAFAEPGQAAGQQHFPSLLESSTASSLPQAPSPSSFLKQTSAAIQSFAELFHLAPSSSPSPLAAALQTPATSTQHSAPLAANEIDQQAEARSLHEHWTQQQKRAHNQAGQMSAFQSFTTSPSVQLSARPQPEPGHSHQHHLQHHHHHQHQLQHPQQSHNAPHQQHNQQQNAGSQASYWLTSNPLSAPDGNFLVEIKNAGESSGNQEAENSSPRAQHHQQEAAHTQAHQQPPQSHHQPQLGPPATTASSFTRPASAQSSFLSTPSSAYFGAQSGASLGAAAAITPPNAAVAAAHHQTPAGNQQAPAPPPHRADRFTPQNFRKPNFQPQSQSQSQALHQHQARSLSAQQQQQQLHLHHHQQQQLPALHQLRQPPAHHQVESLEAGQLRPPANTPDHFGGVAPAAHSSGPATPLKSAEESLIAFRQQQQSHHDQQSALLSAVQSQYAAHTGGEPSSTTGNSLTYDEPAAFQPQTHPGGEPRAKLPVGGLAGNTYSAPGSPQIPARQQSAPPQTSEIPKVSPQIYESFLLQQKDQYEKHMELLKQQQELNKLLEQKQKQQQQQQQQGEAEKRKKKKEEIERAEARKKASAAREQEQQLVAARKARQEAEEARRKQQRLFEEEEAKKRRLAEEERRYRELLEAREREEAKRKRLEAEQAAELARRQREQQERDALAEQQKKRREQQSAAEEAAKQQQQYRNYLKQQEELKKLLELKQKEDETAQARRSQAGQLSQPQPQPAQTGRLTSALRANKLALEHKERAKQQPSSHWGGRQTRARAAASGQQTGPDVPETRQAAPSASLSPSSTTPSATTSATTPAAPAASSTPKVGTRLSAVNRRSKQTDEKLIRQKIPLYSGAGKYGLYRSDSNSDELAKLLEAVTLPPSSSTTSTTPAPTAPTAAQPPASPSGNGADHLDPDEPRARLLASSSLSPLLNLRELGVTPPSQPQGQARAPSSEHYPSTTIFDDDVPRRPARNPAPSASSQLRRSLPTPISPAASVTSTTRTRLTSRMGSPSPGGNSSSPASSSGASRGASIGLASLPADSDNDGIPGRAGVEYPVLAEVPQTSFSCSRMKLSGFFADTETACQVVHLCQDGLQSSILCPNGTIFNQEKFSCQWWYEVNCARAPMFYQLNDNLYKSTLTSGEGASAATSKDSAPAAAADALNKRTRTDAPAASNSLKRS